MLHYLFKIIYLWDESTMEKRWGHEEFTFVDIFMGIKCQTKKHTKYHQSNKEIDTLDFTFA